MRHVNTDYTETLKCVSSHTVRRGVMQRIATQCDIDAQVCVQSYSATRCDATYYDAMRHVNTDYTETLKCVSSHTVRCGVMHVFDAMRHVNTVYRDASVFGFSLYGTMGLNTHTNLNFGPFISATRVVFYWAQSNENYYRVTSVFQSYITCYHGMSLKAHLILMYRDAAV
ncbi:hypothetical protein J6590_009469 [Homalodisca vitripennis]|nr:hypothetical protein J6590_009469 [Homalodisca vitripennis]